MGEVSAALRFPNPKLRLSGKIIAMGMNHYRKIGHPCNGFHELFFNGLMFVLQGVVGANLAELEQNADLFVGDHYQMQAKGGRYKLDTLIVEHMAGDEMCLLKFDRGNWPTTNVDSEQESDDLAMNE